MKPFELLQFQSSAALAQVAALAWLEEVEKSDRAGQPHCVALSGGRITREFFSTTVEMARRRKTGFRTTHFFWADERCVAPSDSESNYQMAKELLFEPLKISDNQIHRVRGEDAPESAATSATSELRRFATINHKGIPVLDLIFLGLGEDGHVASLFPGNLTALSPTQVYRAVANSPKPPPNRVSLDYPMITSAKKVWLLASGKGKEKALHDSLVPDGTTPFARVLQSRSDTRILSDISPL